MDQNARQQIIERLKEANNVLVTVSNNPSVDQLAACIGFTLLLNHLGKHGTAVFSGTIPSTIEFLKPDDTIEKNTDSLRDFIIALDKAKADKLRYKVEDKVVKIFITPYRTSLSDKDLDFSQGDFNVDAVVALGVHERTELDQAITAHGRILHDATVISVNNKDQGELGAINWIDITASSLSEMLVELAKGLSPNPLDAQMATAFMTGIVAETDRFSNAKTSPRTMTLSAELMSVGANQQLIASKLEVANEKPAPVTESDEPTPEKVATGELQIEHQGSEDDKEEVSEDVSEEVAAEESPKETETPEESEPLDVNASGMLGKPLDSEPLATPVQPLEEGAKPVDQAQSPLISHSAISKANDRTPRLAPSDLGSNPNTMALQPPVMGGQFTANSQPEHLQKEPSTDPLSLPAVDNNPLPPLLNRPSNMAGTPIQQSNPLPTLSNLESSVGSPHAAPAAGNAAVPDVETKEEVIDDAREAVDVAIASEAPSQPLAPIEALGAQPVNLNLGNNYAAPATTPPNPAFAPTPAPTSPPSPEPFAPNPGLPPTPTPAGVPLPTPTQPSTTTPFGAPADMNGVNPNLSPSTDIPPSLLPPSQPVDRTAGDSTPGAPPPVPPPLMPPQV
ncbi:MAG: hypothetical protein QG553_120 [Patescibacteria group bacterium]|nr:hypothetical protein [Patescibacteria group bacterium]